MGGIMPETTSQRLWQPDLDLEWLRTAPLLVDNAAAAEDCLRPHFPQAVPNYAARLICDFCNRRDHGRLGRYFEEMLAGGWMMDPRVKRLISSIQIANNGITEGELDFVMLTDAGWQHVEVAVKFYFGTQASADPMTWAGPNQIDKLGLKLNRLNNKQLILSETAKQHLQTLDIEVQCSSALIFGILFYHPDIQTPSPVGVSDGHQRGWWVHLGECDRIPAQHTEQLSWSILPRQQWLHGLCDEQCGWQDLPEKLEAAFASHPLPRMVVGYQDGVPVTRGFIAPDGWLAEFEARG